MGPQADPRAATGLATAMVLVAVTGQQGRAARTVQLGTDLTADMARAGRPAATFRTAAAPALAMVRLPMAQAALAVTARGTATARTPGTDKTPEATAAGGQRLRTVRGQAMASHRDRDMPGQRRPLATVQGSGAGRDLRLTGQKVAARVPDGMTGLPVIVKDSLGGAMASSGGIAGLAGRFRRAEVVLTS